MLYILQLHFLNGFFPLSPSLYIKSLLVLHRHHFHDVPTNYSSKQTKKGSPNSYSFSDTYQISPWTIVAQSCLTPCDPKRCRPTGSSVHGDSQARILEWVAVPSSRASSQPRHRTLGLPHCRQILYHLSHREARNYLQT